MDYFVFSGFRFLSDASNETPVFENDDFGKSVSVDYRTAAPSGRPTHLDYRESSLTGRTTIRGFPKRLIGFLESAELLWTSC